MSRNFPVKSNKVKWIPEREDHQSATLVEDSLISSNNVSHIVTERTKFLTSSQERAYKLRNDEPKKFNNDLKRF